MFAPSTIQIRYGTDGVLPLAAAAGTSQGNLVADQRFDRQRAMDQQLLLANVERNRPVSPFGLQQAAGYNPRYSSAQAGGNITSSRGRAAAPLSIKGGKPAPTLVPATGPLSGARGGGSATMIGHGVQEGQQWQFDPTTGTVQESLHGQNGEAFNVGGPQVGRGMFNQNAQPEMVTPDVRAQLDYLRTIQGQIPEENWNGLFTAAKAGTLKMDQLIDNARQFMPRNSGRMSAADRNSDRFTAEAGELSSILQLPPNDQAQYARRRFNMQDPDIYSDQDAIQALQSRGRQLTALLKPVQNSGGSTPSGGNPIKVQTPEEARQYPSGTYIQTPDGRVMRVP